MYHKDDRVLFEKLNKENPVAHAQAKMLCKISYSHLFTDTSQRYYDLGGRKVSYGSDAHFTSRILDKREEICAALKKIGFTYITVPFKGEHIKVEI